MYNEAVCLEIAKPERGNVMTSMLLFLFEVKMNYGGTFYLR
jgi:hypothetical protein